MASSRGIKVQATSSAKKPSRNSVPPAAPVTSPKWVIVQLTSLGEREKNIDLLTRAAHKLLGRRDLAVFVPAISQKVREESHTMYYMDGYVFVQYADGVHYNRLQDTIYFSTVLTQSSVVNGERKKAYSLLMDREIAPMRAGMENLKIGQFCEEDRVRIIRGTYKGLPARVSFVYEDGKTVQVSVDLRSKPLLLEFPASYLIKITEDRNPEP